MIASEDKDKLGCSVSTAVSLEPIDDLESVRETGVCKGEHSQGITDKIEKLLSFSKLLCLNLQSLQTSRAEILRKTESLSRQLEKDCVSVWSASACPIQQSSTNSSEDSKSDNESVIDGNLQDWTARCRGGVDLPEEDQKSCAGKWLCSCKLCSLRRDRTGKAPPCESNTEMNSNPYCDFETLNTVAENVYEDPSAPMHIRKVCKMQKLKESLEHVKNRNRILKKLLDQCGCTVKRSDSSEASIGTFYIHEDEECDITRNIREELLIVLKDLQRKCRMKDGMIALLADELRRGVTFDQASRILQDLAQPNLASCARDFDRTTLWRYLTNCESEQLVTGVQDVKNKEKLASIAFALVIVIFTLFRFHDCVGVKIAFACDSAFKCISEILWKLYTLLTSCEIIIKIPSCICRQIFLIIPFVLTMINEYVFPYLYKHCPPTDFLSRILY